jgi:hypothetical protein
MEMTRVFGDIIYYPQERNEQDLVGEDGDFYVLLMKEFGYRILRGSAAGWKNGQMYEKKFRSYLKDIKNALEIGTWRGVGTSILAHYADSVTTVDIRYYDIAPRVWLWAGILPKIKYYVAKDNENKREYINSLDFDFAFIDGMHTYDEVKFDFECVKRCGRVLFHDYTEACPGVMKFIDELEGVEKDDPFALWTST